MWFFVQQAPDLEKRALAAKLAKDWGTGSPRVRKTLASPGPYQEKVFAAKVLAGGNILVSTEVAIHLLPEGRRFLTEEQEEERRGSSKKKMSSRSEQSEVRHFDLLNHWLVAGGDNGILSVR